MVSIRGGSVERFERGCRHAFLGCRDPSKERCVSILRRSLEVKRQTMESKSWLSVESEYQRYHLAPWAHYCRSTFLRCLHLQAAEPAHSKCTPRIVADLSLLSLRPFQRSILPYSSVLSQSLRSPLPRPLCTRRYHCFSPRPAIRNEDRKRQPARRFFSPRFVRLYRSALPPGSLRSSLRFARRRLTLSLIT